MSRTEDADGVLLLRTSVTYGSIHQIQCQAYVVLYAHSHSLLVCRPVSNELEVRITGVTVAHLHALSKVWQPISN